MEDKLKHSLARVIKDHRTTSGLSQLELAGILGLTRTSVSNIERGVQGLSVEMLYKIAAAINADAAELLREATESAREPVRKGDIQESVPDAAAADEIFQLLYKELE